MSVCVSEDKGIGIERYQDHLPKSIDIVNRISAPHGLSNVSLSTQHKNLINESWNEKWKSQNQVYAQTSMLKYPRIVYTTSYSYYLPTKRQTYFAHTEFVEYSKVRCSIKLFSLIFFINLYDYFIFISSSQFNEKHPLANRSSFMITQYWRQPLALRYKLSYACRVLLTHMKCICSLMNKYRYGRGVSNEWKQTEQNQTKQKKIGTENMETLCCRRRSIFANLIYPKNVSHITYANIYRSHRNVGCDLKIAPKIKFWSAHTTHTHTPRTTFEGRGDMRFANSLLPVWWSTGRWVLFDALCTRIIFMLPQMCVFV